MTAARRALLPTLLLAACGSESAAPDGPPMPYGLAPRPVLPFPTDELLVPDDATPTGLRMAVGPEGTNLGDVDEALYLFGDDFVDTLGTLDGWSTIAPAFLPAPLDLDPATVPDQVRLVDVDAGGLVDAEVQLVRGETDYGRPQAWIEARPLRPVRPATRHALVALRGLRTEAGEALVRSPTFAALTADGAPPDGTDPARWARARARRAGLEDTLAAAGLQADDVLVADPHTTLSIRPESMAMVRAVQALPAPELELDPDGDGEPDRYAEPTEDPRGNVPNLPYPSVRAMLRVTVEVPSFRADPEARLAVSADRAEIQRTETAELIVTVPEGQGPFPVAVFHHGLGGGKESVFEFLEGLSALGFATVSMDAPLHGFRTDRPGNAGVRFLNVVSPDLVLDNLRAAAVDQTFVVRVVDQLAKEDLLGTGEATIDADRLVYVGISLGAIVGGSVIGLEPRFEAAVFLVGGGSLLEFFDNFLSGFEFDGFPTRLFTTVAQTVLDRGDPSNYAAAAADTQILLIQALDDTTVPSGATLSLARALQLPLVGTPHRPVPDLPQIPGEAERRGWTQFPGSHNLPRGDGPPYEPQARAQAWRFLETWRDTGVARITPP